MSVSVTSHADGRRHLYRQLHEEGSGTAACNAGRALRVGWTVAASSTVNQTQLWYARNGGSWLYALSTDPRTHPLSVAGGKCPFFFIGLCSHTDFAGRDVRTACAARHLDLVRNRCSGF